MARILTTLLLLLITMGAANAQGQTERRHLTGMVLEINNNKAIPFTSVYLKNRESGTFADNLGYFSLMAKPGDTIVFSNVGYKNIEIVLPMEMNFETYHFIQYLLPETLFLEDITIMSFPSKEQFRQAFLDTQVPREQIDRSFDNIAEMKGIMKKQAIEEQYYLEKLQQTQVYMLTGEIPANNYLNPMRWSNFIRDWKAGKFRQDK